LLCLIIDRGHVWHIVVCPKQLLAFCGCWQVADADQHAVVDDFGYLEEFDVDLHLLDQGFLDVVVQVDFALVLIEV